MAFLFLFIIGLFIGSFLNVLSLRYIEGRPIFSRVTIGGRSRCRTCHEELTWFELIPLLSFIIQRGKCRHCFHTISWQYPIVETITGFITAGIPLFLYSYLSVPQVIAQGQPYFWFYLFAGVWLLASYTLITASAIDMRLKILPDQSMILLAVFGVALMVIKNKFAEFFPYHGSFSGTYADVFAQPESVITNLLFALLLALIVFGGVILFTRGRGMGMGDLKLALAIGFLLGWPDVIIAFSSAFIIGAVVGILLLVRKKKSIKDSVPFGPYLAIGIFVTMFYAEPLLRWYFSLVQ